jgi:thiosulfate reductase / polysulfide reductase chain A
LPRPEAGNFRLTVGRCALHTHVSTQNNPYLREIVSENVLWINAKQAAKLGISNGMRVEVRSPRGAGFIRALVTDHIHPETVFMLHGFGHEAGAATRCFHQGLSDSVLAANISDKIGGSPALHDTFVNVRAA